MTTSMISKGNKIALSEKRVLMKKQVLWFTLIALILLFAGGIVQAECPVEKVAITNSEVYGAVNPEKYGDMDMAIRNNDQDTLKKLIAEGSVVIIPSGKKVCVLEENQAWYRKRIEVPDFEVPCWVAYDKLTRVE